MSQQVRALVAAVETLAQSPHAYGSYPCVTSISEPPTPTSDFLRHQALMCYIPIHVGRTLVNIKKLKI